MWGPTEAGQPDAGLARPLQQPALVAQPVERRRVELRRAAHLARTSACRRSSTTGRPTRSASPSYAREMYAAVPHDDKHLVAVEGGHALPQGPAREGRPRSPTSSSGWLDAARSRRMTLHPDFAGPGPGAGRDAHHRPPRPVQPRQPARVRGRRRPPDAYAGRAGAASAAWRCGSRPGRPTSCRSGTRPTTATRSSTSCTGRCGSSSRRPTATATTATTSPGPETSSGSRAISPTAPSRATAGGG